MEERVDNGTPQIIKDVFEFPYRYFTLRKSGKCLDIAAGNAEQKKWLEKHHNEVVMADVSPQHDFIDRASLTETLPYPDNTFDAIYCFETIEHIPKNMHEFAISELIRVAKRDAKIFIGSVNADGPDHVEGEEIWKAKNGKNPYHISEMNSSQFTKMCDYSRSIAEVDGRIIYHGLRYLGNGIFQMERQMPLLQPIVNYAEIHIWKRP